MFQDMPKDPAAARFVYDDVERFSHALERLDAAKDAAAVLRREYFEPATPGLQAFAEKYELSDWGLAQAIRQRPSDYAALHDLPARLAAEESTFRAVLAELKRLFPRARFPPTYFLIGDGRGLASGSTEGHLIAAERRPPAELVPLVAHEMVHFQQVIAQGIQNYLAVYGWNRSLLALAIREGSADFLTALTAGEPTQKAAHAYGAAHEKEVWERFRAEMHGQELGMWMAVGADDVEPCPGLGYFVGFKIVEAFYDAAENKKKAISEILSVTDYPAFLERSGYSP